MVGSLHQVASSPSGQGHQPSALPSFNLIDDEQQPQRGEDGDFDMLSGWARSLSVSPRLFPTYGNSSSHAPTTSSSIGGLGSSNFGLDSTFANSNYRGLTGDSPVLGPMVRKSSQLNVGTGLSPELAPTRMGVPTSATFGGANSMLSGHSYSYGFGSQYHASPPSDALADHHYSPHEASPQTTLMHGVAQSSFTNLGKMTSLSPALSPPMPTPPSAAAASPDLLSNLYASGVGSGSDNLQAQYHHEPSPVVPDGVPATAEEEDPRIRAYAKLEFPSFDIYIQKLSVIIGRRPAASVIAAAANVQAAKSPSMPAPSFATEATLGAQSALAGLPSGEGLVSGLGDARGDHVKLEDFVMGMGLDDLVNRSAAPETGESPMAQIKSEQLDTTVSAPQQSAPTPGSGSLPQLAVTPSSPPAQPAAGGTTSKNAESAASISIVPVDEAEKVEDAFAAFLKSSPQMPPTTIAPEASVPSMSLASDSAAVSSIAPQSPMTAATATTVPPPALSPAPEVSATAASAPAPGDGQSTSVAAATAAAATSVPPGFLTDIDLGPIRAVSRQHARLYFDYQHGAWAIEVLGRNGVVVDGKWKAKGETEMMSARTKIQIAERVFYFVLPNVDPASMRASGAHAADSPLTEIDDEDDDGLSLSELDSDDDEDDDDNDEDDDDDDDEDDIDSSSLSELSESDVELSPLQKPEGDDDLLEVPELRGTAAGKRLESLKAAAARPTQKKGKSKAKARKKAKGNGKKAAARAAAVAAAQAASEEANGDFGVGGGGKGKLAMRRGGKGKGKMLPPKRSRRDSFRSFDGDNDTEGPGVEDPNEYAYGYGFGYDYKLDEEDEGADDEYGALGGEELEENQKVSLSPPKRNSELKRAVESKRPNFADAMKAPRPYVGSKGPGKMPSKRHVAGQPLNVPKILIKRNHHGEFPSKQPRRGRPSPSLTPGLSLDTAFLPPLPEDDTSRSPAFAIENLPPLPGPGQASTSAGGAYASTSKSALGKPGKKKGANAGSMASETVKPPTRVPYTPAHWPTDSPMPDHAPETDPLAKPPYTYASLIAQCVSSTVGRKQTLQGICDWVEERWPYFRYNQQGWQNSIRHNLTPVRGFTKMARTANEPGKGSFWKLDPEFAPLFDGHTLRKKGAKDLRPIPPAPVSISNGQPGPKATKAPRLPSKQPAPAVPTLAKPMSIVIAPLPSTYKRPAPPPNAPPPDELTEALLKDPPIIFHGGKLLLNPATFAAMSTSQLAELQVIPAHKSLQILQHFVVQHFKEKMKLMQVAAGISPGTSTLAGTAMTASGPASAAANGGSKAGATVIARSAPPANSREAKAAEYAVTSSTAQANTTAEKSMNGIKTSNVQESAGTKGKRQLNPIDGGTDAAAKRMRAEDGQSFAV